GPRKKRQNRSGPPVLVSEVEVVRLRIIEVDRELDQAQPEDACVEIKVALRVTRNGGDVMDSFNCPYFHSRLPISQCIPDLVGVRTTKFHHMRTFQYLADSSSG